jgi:hypothetical protein
MKFRGHNPTADAENTSPKLTNRPILVNPAGVSLEGEHAAAAGQVPLLDGRVGRSVVNVIKLFCL